MENRTQTITNLTQQKEFNEKFNLFYQELFVFLTTNPKLKINSFKLRLDYSHYYDIIPISPTLNEQYNGCLDHEINQISKKYNIIAGFAHSCYIKN